MPYVNGTYYETQKEGLKAEREKSRGSTGSSSSSSKSSSSSGGSRSSASSGSGYSSSHSSGLSSGSSSSSGTRVSSTSNTRPSSGGSSYSNPSYSASRDYNQEAQNAAARGDWDAVTRALAARQSKINAQGGNDRGTSNAQILANLQKQYQNSYNALSSTYQDKLNMAASGQLNGSGWESGHDYLSEAQAYARTGDMEAALDALRRRGFKMADTGSLGGGISQDQAYAMIQGLYDHSPGAASSYQGQLAENARRLAEHPTQFGTGTNPSLANKHFASQDGQYIIYYDSSGTPFKAQPNNGQYGSTKYTPEYTGLMERYYSGAEDFADLRRQMHNLDVVHSGNGRLLDQNWNWASGEAIPIKDAYQYWTDLDNGAGYRNVGQDKGALAAILAQINSGQTFQSPTQVPAAPAPVYDDLPSSGGRSGRSSGGSGRSLPGGGNGMVSASGGGDYAGDDLSEYIRQMYQQSLEAQLAGLKSSYDQSRAAYEAQNDQIAKAYYAQRNQAAAQNELQRMYMAELGNYQGLNTGATGQLALAQTIALQNDLASIGTAEGQDLAANGLAMNQLLSGYLGSVNQAQAQNYSQLAGALYDEYARQIQAAEDARQAAQAQANWEAQFNYQMQQDAMDRAWQQQQFAYQQQTAADEYQYQLAQLEAAANKQNTSNAWDYAQLLLKNGVMPDENTLYAAGLDAGSAQSLADSYKWQLGQKYKTKSGSSGGNPSLKSGMGGGDYNALFQAAQTSGYPESFIPNNYKAYGFSSGSNLVDDYYTWDGTIRGGNGSFDYSPDEGIYTWNGNRYNSVGNLASAIESARLNSAEKKALADKMKMYGIDVEF